MRTPEAGLSLNIYNRKRKDEYQSESSASFMWMYLFMEILRMMPLNSSLSSTSPSSPVDEKNELVTYLRGMYADSEENLRIIEEFSTEYSSDRSVWWYTRDAPFYQQLNKALRYKNLKLLFLFRFFIFDILQQLIEKHKQQMEQQPHNHACRSRRIYHVYRGQWMSSDEFERLADALEEFVSVNSFMSATLERNVALKFIELQKKPSQSLERVLFKIEIEPHLKTPPYANIKNISYFAQEEEVLFMPGTIFKIQNIGKSENVQNLSVIQLKLCSEDDRELRGLISHWKENIESETNQATLGWLLMQTGQSDQALIFYETLLSRLLPDDPLVKYCYNGLGNLHQNSGDYAEAADYHMKALNAERETHHDQKWLAKCYSALADDYLLAGRLNDALDLYQQALPIYKSEYGEVHRDIVKCHTNIGHVYREMKNYDSAKISYECALELDRRIDRSRQDPLYLITSLTNLAQIYRIKRAFPRALSTYNEALVIYRGNLRSNDPRLGILHEDIGHVHRKHKKFNLALVSFHRAAEIYYYSYPQTDEHNERIRKAIGYCNKKMRYISFSEAYLHRLKICVFWF